MADANNIDVNFLIDMIKFDMQQIQAYRAAILEIAIGCISASFATSTFLWGKGEPYIPRRRYSIAMTVNAGLIVILMLAGVEYFDGLNMSRLCLDKREDALKMWVTSRQTVNISAEQIYPAVEIPKGKGPVAYVPPCIRTWLITTPLGMHMPLYLEKSPIWVALLAVLGIMLMECRVFASSQRKARAVTAGDHKTA